MDGRKPPRCSRSTPWALPSPARTLLHDVSLTLEPGRVLGLIGHNGSGKTSF